MGRTSARRLWIGAPVAVMLALWVTSSLPATGNTLGGIPMPKVLQKLAHVIAYGSLGAAWFVVFAGRPARRAPALVLATLYAMVDEFHQTYVPNRTGTPWDVLLDAASAALGIALAQVVQRRRARALDGA